jgi:DNA-binding LytR/AlgR family response regulator
MNCIAVDDEKLVLDLLVDNIQQVPFLHLVKRCKNTMEAAEALHAHPVDLIFLDIQMPGLNGLQFMQSLQHPPMVIFVTAYASYALDGFNLDAVDYLLKPVSFERFLKACNKAYELFQLQRKAVFSSPEALRHQGDKPDYFFVYVEYVQVKVSIPDILYIEGMKDYVKIFLSTTAKPIITKMSMKALQEKLQGHRFVRTHKSFIVAADKVTAIKRDLICIGVLELPLSESYKSEVEKMLAL